MTTRYGQRVLSLLSLLLFLSGTSGDALSRHLCPHHDGELLAATQDGQHGHHQAAPGDSDKDHEGCTCIGRCVQNTPAALPAAATVTLAFAPATSAVPTFRVHSGTYTRPPHYLPLANAPPVIA
jgi:hypothetical protein